MVKLDERYANRVTNKEKGDEGKIVNWELPVYNTELALHGHALGCGRTPENLVVAGDGSMGGLRDGGRCILRVCGHSVTEPFSQDGSFSSLSTDLLPSLGARSNRRVKLRKGIISPHDHRYRSLLTNSL